MNQYFLLIACLQLFPAITPISPITTWVPLLVIFSVTAIKEAFDDYARYNSDKKFNNREYRVLRDGDDIIVKSKDILVGDIISVDENQEIPCDMVLLYSSRDNGECYVQTANVDGETDLKLKFPALKSLRDTELQIYRAEIECPYPNRHIYSFDANLRDGELTSLNYQHLLLQGTFVKNTNFVYGVAVYTGHETKLGMNKNKPQPKITRLDRQVDMVTRRIFLIQLILIIVLGTTGNLVYRGMTGYHWYLYLDSITLSLSKFVIVPLRMLLLMSFMIPISLKVTLDIIKFASASFINWDIRIYDPITNEPAVASNTAIAEDLGQIEYVFTDKTGTLTENEMIFRSSYLCPSNSKISKNSYANLSPSDEKFWSAIALCHSVVPIEEEGGKLIYRGSSPDEEVLVSEANNRGVHFIEKDENILKLRIGNQIHTFEVLETLEFTSDRKRMSIIVRGNERRIMVLTKGADEVIYERSKGDLTKTKENVDFFASKGWRTLIVGKRELEIDEYEQWSNTLKNAKTSLQNREQLIQKAYDEIEQRIEILGATAIEDKLQSYVPSTIEDLRVAGLKIWMLTGDKMATAKQIALSCNLLRINDKVIQLEGQLMDKDLRELLEKYRSQLEQVSDDQEYSIVIDGSALKKVFETKENSDIFSELCIAAKSVIGCRVTPHQKAAMVEMIKSRNHATLAVGDGGNDVAMIQKADVGVGIHGKEGTQAVRASDYSIGRFYFLSRLLLVHGRYAYKRTAYVALYCFYKSIYLGVIQASFQIYCAFSGSSLLNTFSLSSYNILFTSFPIIFYMLDKDVPEIALLQNPSIYRETVRGDSFSIQIFVGWFVRALFHGFFTVISSSILAKFYSPDGTMDFNSLSMTSFTIVIFVQTLIMLIESHYLTYINFLAIFGSLISYLVISYVFSNYQSLGFFMSIPKLFRNASFWIFLTVFSIFAVGPIIAQYAKDTRSRESQRLSHRYQRLSESIELESSSESLASLLET
jgi:phospholipid-translocating ATPase